MRTNLRLSVATLITLVRMHAVACAATVARFNAKGEMMPEPTTAETIVAWFPLENILVVLITLCLPGIPMSIFWPFAALTLYAGWKFAICLSFGYYLLQFLIGGANAYD